MVEPLRAPPLRIGLTGGIGSGKSTVAAAFVARGAALIDADAIARSLTQPGGAAIAAQRIRRHGDR
jgi:dephospho-CoA kinase